jgi:hypothetical protein
VFGGMRDTWGDRRVVLLDDAGQVQSLPLTWTDWAEPDVFVTMSAGRSVFRVTDLIELASMMERLQAERRGV